MAKNSILDITIRLLKEGNADKDVVKGLANVKSTVAGAVTAFAAFAGAAYAIDKGLDATVGKLVEYADQVRNVQYTTGASAQEASRMIQVADDAKISYEALSKAMKQAVKEGVTPNIAGLAALSDQYLALAPGQERAAFLFDKFGKSGGDMAELMSKGGAAIREMSDGIDSSLILSQEAVDQAREYEMALDALDEQAQALSLSLGQRMVPALTKLIEGTTVYLSLAKDEEVTYTRAAISKNAIEMATRKQTEALYAERDALSAHAEALSGEVEILEEANFSYKDNLATTLDLQKGYDDFADKQAEVEEKIRATVDALASGEITSDEYKNRMSELNGEYRENAAAAEEWAKRTVFAMLQTRVASMEGGSEKEKFSFLVNIGEQMGIIDETTADMAQSLNESMDSIDLSKPQDFYETWKDIMHLPHEQTFTITTTTETETTTTNEPWRPQESGQGTGAGGFLAPTPSVRAVSGGKSIYIANLVIYTSRGVTEVLEELT